MMFMDSVTLLPADRYVIYNKTILTEFDHKTLIAFYEPIIGHLAVSLYLTLENDLDNLGQVSREFNHHHLMSILKCRLDVLKSARESLEAVGLLKTYFKSGNVGSYIYELYSPLSPVEFLAHPILSVVLYNNIGASEYEYLKKMYQKLRIDTKEYTDISKRIDEVYTAVAGSSVAFDSINRSVGDIECAEQVDFDLIISSIPKGIINDKAFNKGVRKLINQLAFVYKIDSLKMMELIRSVLNEFGMIDKNALRLAARKMYQFNNGALPTLIYRSQPEYLKTPAGDNSMRGKIIQAFESINPVDFLRVKYRGVKPTNADIKIIEMLIIDLELPPAVVNVLLDYVLRKNNNRLSKGYIETIAGQWKRAGLTNASDAMDFAERENKRLSKKLVSNKSKAQEPVWFNNKDNTVQELSKEEQEEIENLFKEFK